MGAVVKAAGRLCWVNLPSAPRCPHRSLTALPRTKIEKLNKRHNFDEICNQRALTISILQVMELCRTTHKELLYIIVCEIY